jgi:hypothetical protein
MFNVNQPVWELVKGKGDVALWNELHVILCSSIVKQLKTINSNALRVKKTFLFLKEAFKTVL